MTDLRDNLGPAHASLVYETLDHIQSSVRLVAQILEVVERGIASNRKGDERRDQKRKHIE
jgi:hypothetical protein